MKTVASATLISSITKYLTPLVETDELSASCWARPAYKDGGVEIDLGIHARDTVAGGPLGPQDAARLEGHRSAVEALITAAGYQPRYPNGAGDTLILAWPNNMTGPADA